MSGGSMGYLCWKVEENAVGQMRDAELDEMMADVAVLLHACEWWQSGDYGEEQYREKAKKFKEKWFGNFANREARLERIIDQKIAELRRDCKKMIGR